MECECGKDYNNEVHEFMLKLDTENFETCRSVELLLDNAQRIDCTLNSKYQCRGDEDGPGCGKEGSCREYTKISFPGDVLIIQLQMFRWNALTLKPQNINPQSEINEKLVMHEFGQNDKYELRGIVWHEGETAISGHYTSNVKIDDRWFFINDTDVSHGFKSYKPHTKIVPYILLYKKCNGLVISSPGSHAIVDLQSCVGKFTTNEPNLNKDEGHTAQK